MSDKQFCNSGEFEAKVAVITGAGRGIGKTFARALAERGAAVGILDCSETTSLQTAQDLNNEGHRAIGIACDVSNETEVAAAVAQVEDT
jgi:NAD(P)-dependent dehydrogenase (short-subunit alcohol dehydrogenase family)